MDAAAAKLHAFHHVKAHCHALQRQLLAFWKLL